jgi:hypothetical protein
MNITKLGIFSLLISAFLSSCIEEEPKIVPDVYVNFTINLDLPEFIALKSINNAIKKSYEGYDNNGVILYRYTLDEYIAFDATCPQHIETSTSISLDEGGVAGTATCPHCNTTYSFFNFGQASSGYPLKRYRTNLRGTMLDVFN